MEAEGAEWRAVAAAGTAQEALNRDNRAAATGATATPPPPTHQQSVNSRSERPGDAVFFEESVQFMASLAREELSSALGASVVVKASTLLASVRKTSLHPADLLSMRRAWSAMDHRMWQG